MLNKSWIVTKASTGVYETDCMRWEECETPAVPEGKVLVRTLLLSLDPTSRNWLKLDPTMQYIPFGIGDPMMGVAVGIVEESRVDGFDVGDIVTGLWGWQLYSVAEPYLLEQVRLPEGTPLEAQLSVFSHVGRAAVMGLVEVGGIKPSDAVLVTGAAGATGGIAAQIAKAYGCRVVGIAGGPEKCRFLKEELQLDGVIDYRSENVAEAVARLFPSGVDLFFDNVGGEILDAVLANMAIGCRVVICGSISQYDLEDPSRAYGVKNIPLLFFRQARMQGFVVPQFFDRYAEFDAILQTLYREGKILDRSHVVEGLEQAPEALKLILTGRNEGKLMVRVSDLAEAP